MTGTPSIHASCVVVGEAGALLRGASGSGKSSLSVAVIEAARLRGLFARLVADDRTVLRPAHGRLIASPPATIAGMIERRGVGVVDVPWLAEAVVRLVVDIGPTVTRLPDEAATRCAIEGVILPRLALASGDPAGASLVLDRLDTGREPRECDPFALAFGHQRGKIARSAPRGVQT